MEEYYFYAFFKESSRRMSVTVCIEQEGIVEAVNHRQAKVKVMQASACALCHAKSMCAMLDFSEKIIDAFDMEGNISQGDRVKITMTQSMGRKAVLLGYLIPFLVFLASLILLSALGIKDLITGLASLAVLAPYYIVLYMFRKSLQKSFRFTIKKVV